jgi:hypothetical protein
MTDDRPNDVAMRKRHLKFVAALIGVTAFCLLALRREERRDSPSIDIGRVTYISEWRPAGADPMIEVSYVVTNTGPSSFLLSPWMADEVRFDAGNGWERNEAMMGLKQSKSVVILSNSSRLFTPGEVATGTAWIPEKAQRWRIGYFVRFPSTQKKLEARLGTNWTRRATTLLGDEFSENGGYAEVCFRSTALAASSPSSPTRKKNGAEFAEKCQAICAEHGAAFESESRSVELDLLATEIRIKVAGPHECKNGGVF